MMSVKQTMPLLTAIFCFLLVMNGCTKANKADDAAPGGAAGGFSISPFSGSGSSQVFLLTISGSSPDHPGNNIRVLFNTDLDGRRACYLYFFPEDRSLHLVQDSGDGSVRGVVGETARLENSQCSVDAANALLETSEGKIFLRMPVHFKPGFSGEKKIFLAGGSETDQGISFKHVGNWVVP